MTSSIENPHLGTTLDDFLAEEGVLENASRTAASRVSAWQESQGGRSLWQVAQSGYDVFIFQGDGPLVRVTDENADGAGIARTADGGGHRKHRPVGERGERESEGEWHRLRTARDDPLHATRTACER